MNVAFSLNDLKQHLDACVMKARFSRTPITLREQDEWSVSDGVLTHRSGGFFHVLGRVDATGNEELIYYQPQNALDGLALHQEGGELHLLLQVRIEPGNSLTGNFGPTVQSTAANYNRCHGGRKTELIELFQSYTPGCMPVCNSTQYDFGTFYVQKTKLLNVVELDSRITPPPGMIWVPWRVMIEALSVDYLINTDLRAMLPTIDWRGLLERERSHSEIALRDAFPLPAAVTGVDRLRARLVPLDALTRWRLDDTGVVDLEGRGRSLRFYDVQAEGREVRRWAQPLMHTATKGRSTLLMRNGSSGLKFLVSFAQEWGVSGGVVIGPSHVTYAGDRAAEPPYPNGTGRVVHCCHHSEEGGRFFEHENLYQVIEVDPAHPAAPNQKWITAPMLREVLQTSNRTSMHLRGVCSLVMGQLV